MEKDEKILICGTCVGALLKKHNNIIEKARGNRNDVRLRENEAEKICDAAKVETSKKKKTS